MKVNRWVRTVGAGALLGGVLLATAGLAGATSVTAVKLVSGSSPYANCTAGGGPAGVFAYTNAEVEPYIAVNSSNSQNMIGVWQQDRWNDGGAHGLAAAYTTNGGKTWKETTLPFSQCANGGANYERATDPWVSFGPDGTAYAVSVSFDESANNNAVVAAVSTNGGKSWKNTRIIHANPAANYQYFDDKESITADPVQAGVAYAVWDTLEGQSSNPYASYNSAAYKGPGMFSKTTDGGKTWSEATVMFPTTKQNTQTIGNVIVVDPRDGTLYDFTDWIAPPSNGGARYRIAFVKSTDGGATWSAPQAIRSMDVLASIIDPNTGAIIRTGDIIPEPAIDPNTGKLYVAYQTADFSGGAYEEVAVISSSDGGATWSDPVRASTPTGAQAFTPMISVNADGVVGVTYYDFRNTAPGNTTTLPTDYWFVSSTDGGASFGNEVHLFGPFDMLTAPYASGYFTGDYEGLVSSGSSFVPFWVAANSGDTSNPTDVFSLFVTP